ncbi:MAG TPA: amino acid permease [Kofleriaceae bacterium]|nr:amino acid permease [Kofleriaceae bacterium]
MGESGDSRTVGLAGATTVGVGAIVGGGIMVLAGVAFASAGPAAMVAFALNGVVALITALSFAEIATRFPESGGAYTFAKKVLSVRLAFAVGWVLWFAYIVAGVLYALGFATFALEGINSLWSALGGTPPEWLAGRGAQLLFAMLATAGYALSLIRQNGGGGEYATYGKVIAFGVMIVVGVVVLFGDSFAGTGEALTPFFDGGASGLFAAMGFTFIALQGFDLIPAIGGEVKDPERTIPRAMFLSLGLAMAIYMPLLFVVTTAGVGEGQSITSIAQANPGTVFATAVGNYMGRIGYWLVIVAAILSTLSALRANLLAASRVALTMARDRTLPAVLGGVHETRQTPIMAIYATALTLVAILFMVPNLGAAGAAASLIFLISFAMVHFTSYLARRRGDPDRIRFRTPYFPLIPIGGGVACGALAVFQAVVVPSAGSIVLIWLGLGVLLYFALFRDQAETADASAEAYDPNLSRLRGKNPLVLLPIANPAHAVSLVAVATAMAPRKSGRVLLLTIVHAPEDSADERLLPRLVDAQEVVQQALAASYRQGQAPEALITAAAKPWAEIRRVAEEHDCESILLGLGADVSPTVISEIDELIDHLECDVAVMRAADSWRLADARRILVPVGGGGEVHEMRARVLGSICRGTERAVTIVRVLPARATDAQVADALRGASAMAVSKLRVSPLVQIVRSDDPVATLVEMSRDYDLVLLGVAQTRWGRAIFGGVPLEVARQVACAAMIISRRRAQIYSEVYRPLRDAVRVIPRTVMPPREPRS